MRSTVLSTKRCYRGLVKVSAFVLLHKSFRKSAVMSTLKTVHVAADVALSECVALENHPWKPSVVI
jgi:hypothetical protein